ncbi:ABC-three component system middle component 2 [Vreelandella titanicae]|uniref:ABC-three component system middle component 2 n=1 Tax=Vreelandella titanicae TaxID=664683 RepID=UPI001142B66A|nr:ABC-three component system middle component 2 [Halomonas titanicae]
MEVIAKLYNSPLESGMRSLIILDCFYPKGCDLTQITWLDYLVVNTEDVGGPASLHPKVDSRKGGELVKRKVVYEGLRLMVLLQLVDVLEDGEGVSYKASEDSKPLIDLMDSSYSLRLKERAVWLAKRFRHLDKKEFEYTINQKLGKWSLEFNE